MRIIEEKGLGMAVRMMPVGEKPTKEHREYALVVTNEHKYNIAISKSPVSIEDATWIFPLMVSEQKARDKYNELK